MIQTPERSPERDAAITAMLPHVPFDGWTRRALGRGLSDLGSPADEAALLFPGGAIAMVEAFCDLADRRMAEEAATLDLSGQGLTARVRAVIALRLAQSQPCKEAVRRAVSVLALPIYARTAAATAARTADAIWHAAGDRSADFSWYTKRAILMAIYSATLFYWLHDSSEDNAATLAFLDRRLAGIGRFGKAQSRATSVLRRFAPRLPRAA
jgi:ubiquinone biosynthesis protein COQ9